MIKYEVTLPNQVQHLCHVLVISLFVFVFGVVGIKQTVSLLRHNSPDPVVCGNCGRTVYARTRGSLVVQKYTMKRAFIILSTGKGQ